MSLVLCVCAIVNEQVAQAIGFSHRVLDLHGGSSHICNFEYCGK